MSKRKRGRTTWLPISVLRPFGPCDDEAVWFEEVILDGIAGSDMESDHPSPEEMSRPGAFLVQGSEAFARVREALERSDETDQEKESVGSALEKAARDPVRHVVIATESASDFGVAILGRSIEYVANPHGGPLAIRYVTEILAAPKPRSEQIGLGLYILCHRAANTTGAIAAGMAAMDREVAEAFDLPIEVHLRATPGADHGFGPMIVSFLDAFDDFLSRFGLEDRSEALSLTGPYLPGTMFADPDLAGTGDTAVRLRTREILRRSNLLGRSAVAALHLAGFTDLYGNEFHAYEANDAVLDAADVILDPAFPRCGDVLDLGDDGVGKTHVQIHPCGETGRLVVVEIVRALDVVVEEGEFIVGLDLSLPALVGDYRDGEMSSAIAAILIYHARPDLAALYADLTGHVRGFHVRFTAPAEIAADLRTQIGSLYGVMEDLPEHLTPPTVEIIEAPPRDPRQSTPATPMLQLPRPGRIDIEAVTDAIEDEAEGEIEVEEIEVLRRRGKKLVWVDGWKMPASTRDPFVLARAWTDEGPPIPIVISSLSGKMFSGDIDMFRMVLRRLQAGPTGKPKLPAAPVQLRELAERMFRNTSIAVAYLDHLLPLSDEGILFGDDPDVDDDLAAHLAIVGGAQNSEHQDLETFEHEYAPAARFHVAVSAAPPNRLGATGAGAIMADFLVRSAEHLIDGEDLDLQRMIADPGVLFLFAYAYVRQCCPDAVSDAEFEAAARKAVDPSRNVVAHAPPGAVPDLVEEIPRRMAAVTSAGTRTPLYLAVARIGAEFEAAVEDWDGFGLIAY
jgi:hypothetical protein